jgi:hypothetical protein
MRSEALCGDHILQYSIVSFYSSRQNSADVLGDDRIGQCHLIPMPLGWLLRLKLPIITYSEMWQPLKCTNLFRKWKSP